MIILFLPVKNLLALLQALVKFYQNQNLGNTQKTSSQKVPILHSLESLQKKILTYIYRSENAALEILYIILRNRSTAAATKLYVISSS